MKIQITFDSLEEFAAHIKYPEGFEDPAIGARYDNYPEPSKFETAKAAVKKIAQEAQEDVPPFEPEEPRENAAHVSGMCPITTQEPAHEPAGTPEAPKPKEEKAEEKPAAAPTIDITAVRKVLSELNAKAGTNVAGRILKAAGFKKLTEVPAEKLPEIMAAAKEQMDE